MVAIYCFLFVWITSSLLFNLVLPDVVIPSPFWIVMISVLQLLGSVSITAPFSGTSALFRRPSSTLFVLAATAHMVSVVLTNAGVAYGSLSGTRLLKSSEPVIMSMLACAFGSARNRGTVLWCCVLTVAVLCASADAVLFPSALSVVLGILASLAYVAKSMILKKSLTGVASEDLTVHSSLNLLALPLLLVALPATFAGSSLDGGSMVSLAARFLSGWQVWACVMLFGIYQLFSLRVLAAVSPVQHAAYKLVNTIVILVVSFAAEGLLLRATHAIPLGVAVASLVMISMSESDNGNGNGNGNNHLTAQLPHPQHHRQQHFSVRRVALLCVCLVSLALHVAVVASGPRSYQDNTAAAAAAAAAAEVVPARTGTLPVMHGGELFTVTRLSIVRSRVSELGCAETCAISRIPRFVSSREVHVVSMAPAPLYHDSFDELRLRRLFADTPMNEIILSKLPMWKLVSGPLFPDQLDFAVQLIVMYRYGGAAATSRILLRDLTELSVEGDGGSCESEVVVAREDVHGVVDSRFMMVTAAGSPTILRWLTNLVRELLLCIDAGICGHSGSDLLTLISARSNGGDEPKTTLCYLGNRIRANACSGSDAAVVQMTDSDSEAAAPLLALSFAECENDGLFPRDAPVSVAFADMYADKCPVCRTGPDWSGERRRLFGSIGYTTQNIGDDTQSLAAMAFLPHIDAFVERDAWTVHPHPLLRNGDALANRSVVYFIGNAFYKENPTVWPPPAHLSPFFISVHLIRSMWTKEASEVFEWYDDLPTRDTATADKLVGLDRNAFFGGCLTSTYNRGYSQQHARTNLTVIAVSAAQTWWYHVFLPIIGRLPGPNVTMEQTIARRNTEPYRLSTPFVKEIESRLETLATARLVITDRLHVAIPAVALGTPTIFMNFQEHVDVDPRFQGLIHLAHIVTEQNTSVLKDFDWENPPPNPNPENLYALRHNLYSLMSQDPILRRAGEMFGAFDNAMP